jgi:hypothetical protein
MGGPLCGRVNEHPSTGGIDERLTDREDKEDGLPPNGFGYRKRTLSYKTINRQQAAKRITSLSNGFEYSP